MAKLRKMLGRADDPAVITLMRRIETQSKATLAAWAALYVEKYDLPIWQAYCPEDTRMRGLIDTVQACLTGEAAVKTLRTRVQEGRKLAQNTADPTAQAAARAIVTACGVLQTPTNALGFCFYDAAAVAYAELGVEQTTDVYDRRADAEFERLLQALEQVMVPDEADRVHIDWNC